MELTKAHNTDLRVSKTQAAIKSAFKEMICEMTAEKITVKELSNRARIHRKTFYLHYTSIEALYQDMMSEIADGYYDEIAKVTMPYSQEQINRVFFEYYAKQEKYVERLICEPSYRPFCDKLHAATLRHNLERHNPYSQFTPEQQNMINIFLVVSSLELYRQWIAGGKSMPLEDVIELSGKLLEHGVSGVLEK